MAINKNLQNLPSGGDQPHDEPPVKDPKFAGLLAAAWAAEYIEDEARSTAAPCRIRHSDAGKCSRALSYQLLGQPVSEPLTLADHYRFNMGHLVHDQYQRVILSLFPDGVVENVVTLGPVDAEGRSLTAGHGDVLVTLTDDGRRYSVELKTINGFGFQKAIGLKGNAEGPRNGAKIQAALNALGSDADVMVLVYLSLDVIGAGPAQKAGLKEWERFSAEWRYERDVFEPIALAELERFNEIVMLADSDILAERFIPDPEIPAEARITNPAKGTWTVEVEGRLWDTGTTWQCNYCPFQTQCTDDAAAGS